MHSYFSNPSVNPSSNLLQLESNIDVNNLEALSAPGIVAKNARGETLSIIVYTSISCCLSLATKKRYVIGLNASLNERVFVDKTSDRLMLSLLPVNEGSIPITARRASVNSSSGTLSTKVVSYIHLVPVTFPSLSVSFFTDDVITAPCI